MSTVVADAEELTPESLTDRLRAHGALPQRSLVQLKRFEELGCAELLQATA